MTMTTNYSYEQVINKTHTLSREEGEAERFDNSERMETIRALRRSATDLERANCSVERSTDSDLFGRKVFFPSALSAEQECEQLEKRLGY